MAGFGERSVDELLTALAQRTPAPGGGSASAWTGAIAASLGEMTAAFADDRAAAVRACELRAQLLEAAEVDLRSYEGVLRALRLPREDAGREPALRAALARAAEPPLEVAEAASELAAIAAGVVGSLRPAVREDAIAAVLLAESVVRCAERLVLANLQGQAADAERARLQIAVRRARIARDDAVGKHQLEG